MSSEFGPLPSPLRPWQPVQRCRKIGVRTVCMWVEDPQALTHLRAMQVDYVQGFGIAKPRPLEGA